MPMLMPVDTTKQQSAQPYFIFREHQRQSRLSDLFCVSGEEACMCISEDARTTRGHEDGEGINDN